MTTNEQLIEEIVESMISNYEFSCEWSHAVEEGVQTCNDLGVKARKSLILHCVNIAKMRWMKLSQEAKNRMEVAP